MPAYKYKAAALNGRAVSGRREAADESDLRDVLKDEQLFLDRKARPMVLF